jgi:hypothetical protein
MSDESPTDRLKRVWAGLKSQIMSRDPETGELYLGGWQDLKDDFKGLPMSKRKRHSRPGIVDETLSLPSLMAIVPGGEKYVPDWALAAAERADQMHQSAREEQGLSEPKGFAQNAEEALGVMLGQVPIPLAKLRQLGMVKNLAPSTKSAVVKKILGSAPEWFSPSIDPSVANYAAGTAFGGGIGGYSDYKEGQADDEANFERATRSLADRAVKGESLIPGYEEGGKVAKLLHFVVDRHTGQKVSSGYQNKIRATHKADSLDNEYGAYRYVVKSEKAPEGTERLVTTRERDDVPSFNSDQAAYAEGGKTAGLRGALHAVSFAPKAKAGFRPSSTDSLAELRAAASGVMSPDQSVQFDRWIKSRENLPELGEEDIDRLLQLHDRIMKPSDDSSNVPWETIFKED